MFFHQSDYNTDSNKCQVSATQNDLRSQTRPKIRIERKPDGASTNHHRQRQAPIQLTDIMLFHWPIRHCAGEFQALVPSGASKGDYEAIELRDGKSDIYGGKGVETAVHNVENILGPALIKAKLDVATDLKEIDSLLREVDG